MELYISARESHYYLCKRYNITVHIFWNKKKTLKKTSYLLINLALADLISWLFSATSTVTFILSYIGIINSTVSISFYVITMASLPLTICIVYCVIWLHLKGVKKQTIRKHCNVENKKLTKTLLIASLLSVVTWLPMSATLMVQIVCKNCLSMNSTTRVVHVARLFQFGNSLLNPVVYSLRMPEFKDNLIQLFCRHRSHRWNKQVPLRPSPNVALKSLTPIPLSEASLTSSSHISSFIGPCNNQELGM